MENCKINEGIQYKKVEEYEIDILLIIEAIILKNQRLVFATVAEKAGVTNLVIKRNPQLRTYILQKIKYYKETQLIDHKIDRAVASLLKKNKALTFISLIDSCNFDTKTVYQSQFLKDKIRKVLSENKPT
ncbi:MAG: hypothetical protein H7Y18_03450 [Clostridiaceae bacterium]|nr:hypothetical protein [Clostridiaceae bacterium]